MIERIELHADGIDTTVLGARSRSLPTGKASLVVTGDLDDVMDLWRAAGQKIQSP